MSFVLDKKGELILSILRVVYKMAYHKVAESRVNKPAVDRMVSRMGNYGIDIDSDDNFVILNTAAELICSDSPECKTCPVNKLCSQYISEAQAKYQKRLQNGITFVDLFCGVGGASLGFEQAGLLPVFALDYEKNAISTYKFNRPYMSDYMVVNDRAENVLDEEKIHTTITGVSRHPHIVFGGVPCQGFSNANRQRLIDDPRNKLYKYFVNAVSYLKPKVIVMENVVGIQKISSQIIEDFERINYTMDFRVFDAVDFGIPQYRKRVIFIGIPKRESFSNDVVLSNIFSEIEGRLKKNSSVVLNDAIYDLRALLPLRKRNDTNFEDEATGYKIDIPREVPQNMYLNKINKGIRYRVIYNHKSRFNNDRDIEIFKRLPQGENSLHEAIADIMPYKERNGIFKDKYYKLKENEPCRTITAHMKFDCNMYIHPSQPRGLTVREAARIQSFPDNYIITGTFQKLYEQVGNAVPPLMAKTIAEVIKRYLDPHGGNNC